jgi:TIR domain
MEVRWDAEGRVLVINEQRYEGDLRDRVDVPVAVLRSLPAEAVPIGPQIRVVRKVLGDREYMPEGVDLFRDADGLWVHIEEADGVSEEDPSPPEHQLAALTGRHSAIRAVLARYAEERRVANVDVSEIYDDEMFYISFDYRASESGSASVLALIDQAREFTAAALVEAEPRRHLRCFISYAREDRRAREYVVLALQPLVRNSHLALWFDTEMKAGEEWETGIMAELNRSDIFLPLLSPDFLASRFCMEVELPRALELERAGQIAIVPLVVQPCDWQSEQRLARLNVLNEGKPLPSTKTARNRALAGVAKALRMVIEQRRGGGPRS